MLNNFIYAQTKGLFLEALEAGNILDEAIVFIEDTKEIWNHGHYFAGESVDPNAFDDLQTDVDQMMVDKMDAPLYFNADVIDKETLTSNIEETGRYSISISDELIQSATGYDIETFVSELNRGRNVILTSQTIQSAPMDNYCNIGGVSAITWTIKLPAYFNKARLELMVVPGESVMYLNITDYDPRFVLNLYRWNWDGLTEGTLTEEDWRCIQTAKHLEIDGGNGVILCQLTGSIQGSERLGVYSTIFDRMVNIYQFRFYQDNGYKYSFTTLQYQIPLEISVDSSMSTSSINPVQNKVVKSYIDTNCNIPIITSSETSVSLQPNKYYKLGSRASNVTITLDTPSNTSVINNYMFEFTATSSNCTLSVPSTIKWMNGETPTIESDKTYQISIINNLATVAKFS